MATYKQKKYKSKNKKESNEIIDILLDYHKDAKCGLNFSNAYELTIALILAAQCTDKRVNEILPKFIDEFKTIKNVANADIKDIIKIIKPCGYYNSKSSSILETSKIIINEFNGNVPDNMKDLLKLKGIGRKSANIILQECFNKTEGIAVDTHVTRISRKIGFSNASSQDLIEKELMNKFDRKLYSKLNHILVNHGRQICIARNPKCNICPINNLCAKND